MTADNQGQQEELGKRVFMLEVHLRGLEGEIESVKAVQVGIAQGEQSRLDEIRRHAAQIDENIRRLSSLETRFAEMAYKCKDVSSHLDDVIERLDRLHKMMSELGTRMAVSEKAKEDEEREQQIKDSGRSNLIGWIIGVGTVVVGVLPFLGSIIDWVKGKP
ncbi:MAG: hypothetical protein H7839_04855 [Magnetococcus sp. YQC-5]